MLVTPMPGVDRQHLAEVLDQVGRSVGNLRGGSAGQNAPDRVGAYLRWANDAVRSLRAQISPADVERLVLTRRYEHLLGGYAHDPQVLNDLLAVELDERVEAFDEASCALRSVIARWSRTGVFVVADTSVYIHHPDKLDDLDLAPLIGARGDDIHVLVPIVVVDELDGLKQSGNNAIRQRARQTLAVLDRVSLTRPPQPGCGTRTSPRWTQGRFPAGRSPSSWCSTQLGTCGYQSTTTRSSTGSSRCSRWRGNRSSS